MDTLEINKRFPYMEQAQISLLRDKYGVSEEQIDEIKEKWKLDKKTGYYYKPSGKFDPNK